MFKYSKNNKLFAVFYFTIIKRPDIFVLAKIYYQILVERIDKNGK